MASLQSQQDPTYRVPGPADPSRPYRPVAKQLLGLTPSARTGHRYPPCNETQPPVLSKEEQIESLHHFTWADLEERRPVISPDLRNRLWSYFDPGFENALITSSQEGQVIPILKSTAERHGAWFKKIQTIAPVAELGPNTSGRNRYSNIIPNEIYRVPLVTPLFDSDGAILKDQITSAKRIPNYPGCFMADADYINASDVIPPADIPGLTQTYIACQAPTEKTISHMWEMIWQQHVETIVFLTKFAEKSFNNINGAGMVTEKSCPYWPLYNHDKDLTPTDPHNMTKTSFLKSGLVATPKDKLRRQSIAAKESLLDMPEAEVGATQNYGAISVTVQKNLRLDSSESIVRTFLLRNLTDPEDPLGEKGENKRIVSIVHFEGWGDHGLPDPSTLFRMFKTYNFLRQSQVIPQSPIVVHCSAGIGRTGTFIGIDMMLDYMRHQQSVKQKIDIRNVVNIVTGMRTCRNGMVQTDGQYSFIYYFLQYCARHPERKSIGLM